MRPARLPLPLVVSFVGWSDSGKTGFLVSAIEECRRRGLPCAAAKATRHGGDFEEPGKDSARFRAAGAAEVAFVGTGEAGITVRFSPTPPEPDRAYLLGLFPLSRLVLAEGLEVEGAYRVLVARRGQEEKRGPDWADAVVTDDEGLAARARAAGKRVFRPGGAVEFVDTLEELMARDVRVTCGGKEVPLNDFVKDIVGNTIEGLVGSLKKTELEGEITVTVGPRK